ncbi:PH domain-containing protein [Helicobacter sp. 13S00482-2]|uniref:PH domain-containing protein n=1 Tax=Helicobacter sp. 13S00482-2 TaxID=1476200 RepID=UPI00117BB84E|nr:PH domain-containing protein [Helicobacter sp. 13S00482-2]
MFPILVTLFGFIILASSGEASVRAGFMVIFFGVVLFIYKAICVWTTELAITEKSVVAKWGLIRRDTIELRINKVESVRLKQGIVGRMLGFGTIIIVGTGSSSAPIKGIKRPIRFKKELIALQEKNSQK